MNTHSLKKTLASALMMTALLTASLRPNRADALASAATWTFAPITAGIIANFGAWGFFSGGVPAIVGQANQNRSTETMGFMLLTLGLLALPTDTPPEFIEATLSDAANTDEKTIESYNDLVPALNARSRRIGLELQNQFGESLASEDAHAADEEAARLWAEALDELEVGEEVRQFVVKGFAYDLP